MSPKPKGAPTQNLAQERLDACLREAEVLEQRVTSACTNFAVTDQLIRKQVRPHYENLTRQLRAFKLMPRLRALNGALRSLTFYRWYIRFHPLSLLYHATNWALWGFVVFMVVFWIFLGFFTIGMMIYLLWQGIQLMFSGGQP